MMRSSCFCCIAIAAIMLTGCVTPPVVSLADSNPTAMAPAAGQATRAPLPKRSLLEEYRRATIEYVPDDAAVSHDTAIQQGTPVPAVATVAQTPVGLPPEIPRVTLRRAILQPVEPENNQPTNLQRNKPIQDISLNIAPPALFTEQDQPIALPRNEGAAALPVLAQDNPFTRGDLVAAGYEWHPSPEGLEFCYQPLYFEEVNLERYGRSFGVLQPAVSAVAFYGRIPLLPYMAFARPARRCTMHAHWTLPGYKIPRWERQPIVPSVHGGIAEVAALYGIILLIP